MRAQGVGKQEDVLGRAWARREQRRGRRHTCVNGAAQRRKLLGQFSQLRERRGEMKIRTGCVVACAREMGRAGRADKRQERVSSSEVTFKTVCLRSD